MTCVVLAGLGVLLAGSVYALISRSEAGPYFGDPVHPVGVVVSNATDVAVLYFVPPVPAHPNAGNATFRLEPGESRELIWAYPPERQGKPSNASLTTRALDERENLIFCRSYTITDLEKSGWQIQIVRGQIECLR